MAAPRRDIWQLPRRDCRRGDFLPTRGPYGVGEAKGMGRGEEVGEGRRCIFREQEGKWGVGIIGGSVYVISVSLSQRC